MKLSGLAILLAMLAAAGCGPRKGPYDTDPREPAEALDSFQIVEGFEIELFAAEPQVVDPVEMCFDENGLIYVAEMLDYPFDPPQGKPPKSRIRVLEDTDGDGRIDKATIFADKLLQATSVFPWKGGIFVAAAPDILYLKDTDGDRKADIREVIYTGFDTNVSPEARITNFRYGLDNWIYAANNGRPGTITSPKYPGKPPVLVRGYDFRFHPETGEFAPAAGPTQYGMSFNDWGDRFVSQNTIHLRHAVLPAQYVLRNPFFTPPSMLHYMSGHDPDASRIFPLTEPQRWRVERTQIRQERYDETQPGRVEEVGGHLTAATGATVYTGDAWPAEFLGNVFVADANGSLVRREILTPEGATYRADRWPQGREFLASTDVWFRPVNLANAPDGNLYVMDFYREYIEEPASIPEAIKQGLQLDFYRGTDRGRIYRIRPVGAGKGRSLQPGLGQASTAELVKTLGERNGWHRLTAQRLLAERRDPAAIPLLETLAAGGELPEARLHALWTLEALGALKPAQVGQALADPHPGVRRNAIRMAEAFLEELAQPLAALARDPDSQVRFQLALTAGSLAGGERVVAGLLALQAEDRWFQTAALTARPEKAEALLARLTESGYFARASEARQNLLSGLAAVIGARRERPEMERLLAALGGRLAAPAWRQAALAGLGRGLAIEGSRAVDPGSGRALLLRLVNDRDPAVRDAASEAAQYFRLPELAQRAMQEAADEDLAIEKRVQAIKLLRGLPFAELRPVVERILASAAPQPVHAACADALASLDSDQVPEVLLGSWAGYGAEARARVVEALLRRAPRAQALLDAVEAGRVEPREIEPMARMRLAQYPDSAIAARAQKLLSVSVGSRAEVVARYRDTLSMAADPARGKAAFEEHCARCHLPQKNRARIGPDLSGVNNKSKEELLTHILDPSFQIEPNYANYLIVDKDGRIFDGLIAGETPVAVTLRGELEDVTVLRGNIAEMRTSSVSLMPEGLEEQMTRQQIADVIAYLRAGL